MEPPLDNALNSENRTDTIISRSYNMSPANEISGITKR